MPGSTPASVSNSRSSAAMPRQSAAARNSSNHVARRLCSLVSPFWLQQTTQTDDALAGMPCQYDNLLPQILSAEEKHFGAWQ